MAYLDKKTKDVIETLFTPVLHQCSISGFWGGILYSSKKIKNNPDILAVHFYLKKITTK